jgi:hypothetical protein
VALGSSSGEFGHPMEELIREIEEISRKMDANLKRQIEKQREKVQGILE